MRSRLVLRKDNLAELAAGEPARVVGGATADCPAFAATTNCPVTNNGPCHSDFAECMTRLEDCVLTSRLGC